MVLAASYNNSSESMSVNKNILFILALAILAGCSSSKVQKNDARQPAQYVNVFIGTGGHGHTYPGATMPFGMVR
jgi:putative alpha-1,2-mannosidase